MRILITGNLGYVGPIVVGHLRNRFPGASLIGYDNGYFAHCHAGSNDAAELRPDRQIFGDVREFPPDLLEGVDAIVHLAAISNDPMSQRFEDVTGEINCGATIAIAAAASRAGVKSFVFASSCGVYGAANGAARRETDDVEPLTAYARSKIEAERHLHRAKFPEMTLTCLRFATACGMSPRLRLDLVLNDFVACALANGRITVLSDGTPWRPLIDVEDMARAIEWALARTPSSGGTCLTVNVGCDDQNYRIKELAETVAATIPGTIVTINSEAPADRRSYRVDFSLFQALAPEFAPRVSLVESVANLRKGLTAMGFADTRFRNSERVRLKALEAHLAAGRLKPDLRWANSIH
jgi:nucleoside-diphosphate-sugar epimerase